MMKLPDSPYMIFTYSLGIWAVLEVLTMLLNRNRRALHDSIAGSVVVRLPPTPAR